MTGDNINFRSERRTRSTLDRRWAPGTPADKIKTLPAKPPAAVRVDPPAEQVGGIDVEAGADLTLGDLRATVALNEALGDDVVVRAWTDESGRVRRLGLVPAAERGIVPPPTDSGKPTTIIVQTTPEPTLTERVQMGLARQRGEGRYS